MSRGEFHERSTSVSTYVAPTLTRIGSFQDLTKSLGHAAYKDILGFRALIVIYP
jgi:hypothetical protein